MKTKILTTAAIIILACNMANATEPMRTLNFKDIKGRVLTMPVKPEAEVADTLPMHSLLNEKGQSYRNFDLSKITKPEAEVNDVPSGLEFALNKKEK